MSTGAPRATGRPDATRVLYCAGAKANPHGARYQALVTAGYDVFAPDYRGLDVATAAERTRAARYPMATPSRASTAWSA